MMKREECLQILAKHRKDEIVVNGWVFEWPTISGHDLDIGGVGAMGHHAGFALGLALAQPDRRVVCLIGDGAILMDLGALVTIGSVAPQNLTMMVMENGTYEITGGQPIPGAGKVNLATMAKGAGWSHSYEFKDLGAFEENVEKLLKEPGPIFADLKVTARDMSFPVKPFPRPTATEIKENFRAALSKIVE
ncbi:MAG: thiamine pyrophosphate-binding protein [Candidatus Tectomicrobia bacterium]|nr:thiamine pyrophosphate-binding protein [Candidatus Tectomicrobia bacterium]